MKGAVGAKEGGADTSTMGRVADPGPLRWKRVLDLALCLVLCPLALPLAVLIALAVAIESGRPVCIVQRRTGRYSQEFDLYKFRTLRGPVQPSQSERAYMQAYITGNLGAEDSEGGAFKPDHSERLTRVGRWLRRTSLDEMAQLVNILRGEMSLVGPRPHVTWETELYDERQAQRLLAPPGITGLAQINGRSGIDFEDMVHYDLDYIVRCGPRLDLAILARTLAVVFRSTGAR